MVTSRIDDVRMELSLTAVAAYGASLLGDLVSGWRIDRGSKRAGVD